MADVLIIDLDGVVRNWDPALARAAEQRYALPVGCIEREAFATESLTAAVTGKITDDEWRSGAAASLAHRYGPPGSHALWEWSESCGRVNIEVLEVVRQQRRNRRVALFSNATTRLATDLVRLGLDGEFDLVLNSSELGARKPDERAFRAALGALGTQPGNCLFVDDTAEHVRAAAALGLHTHQFHDVAGLATFLSEHPVGTTAFGGRSSRSACFSSGIEA
jgi:putative hydrolase of the HAD superfamily